MKRSRDGIDTAAEQRSIKRTLTDKVAQFKVERISQKVEAVKRTAYNVTRPNVHERRTGHTLTPLISGKIQYAKMLKKDNFEAVRNEMRARDLAFDENTTWTKMIKAIKEHEGDKKYFSPRTNYTDFKWNSTHYDAEGNVI